MYTTKDAMARTSTRSDRQIGQAIDRMCERAHTFWQLAQRKETVVVVRITAFAGPVAPQPAQGGSGRRSDARRSGTGSFMGSRFPHSSARRVVAANEPFTPPPAAISGVSLIVNSGSFFAAVYLSVADA